MRQRESFFWVLGIVTLVVVLGASLITFWVLYSYRKRWVFNVALGEVTHFLPVRDVQVSMDDGVRLRGWVIRRKGIRSTVWIFPDVGESRVMWWDLLSTLYDWGYNGVIFNLRGHEPSEGRFTLSSVLDRDLQVLVRFLQTSAYPSSRIALLGHGLGGYLAMRFVCYAPDAVQLLVLEDPVMVPLDRVVLSVHLPIPLYRGWPYRWWSFHSRWIYGSDANTSGVDCLFQRQRVLPTAMLVSSAWPADYIERIYRRLPEPKELISIPAPLAEGLTQEEWKIYRHRLMTLLDRYFPEDIPTVTVR